MKFPKTRANIYLVVRLSKDNHVEAVCGAFSDLVEADDYKDSCAADFFDKSKFNATFSVMLTSFYG